MATIKSPPAGVLPRVVGLAYQMFKIIEVLDTKNEFKCDFLLYQKWIASEENDKNDGDELDGECTWHPHLKFRNAIDVDMQYERAWVHHHDSNGDAVIWKYQRYQGNFYQSFNLKNYPFDAQDLCIVVDSALQTYECIFRQREDVKCSFSGANFELMEWDFLKPMSQSGVLISPTGLIFPKFTANLPVRRRSEYYTWNVFLVIIGVCIFGNFVYFIEPTAISDRLGFTVSIVFTQIALKYTISTRVPLIPYLSYLDKVMLISLLIAVLTAIENAVVYIYY